jgi:hypothetical protein
MSVQISLIKKRGARLAGLKAGYATLLGNLGEDVGLA